MLGIKIKLVLLQEQPVLRGPSEAFQQDSRHSDCHISWVPLNSDLRSRSNRFHGLYLELEKSHGNPQVDLGSQFSRSGLPSSGTMGRK